MASATANRGRSPTGGQVPATHLGSFARMEIADFDRGGRYPTTPSPQEFRHAPSLSAGQWYGDQAQTSVPMNAANVNHTQGPIGDRSSNSGYFFDPIAQPNGRVASGSYAGAGPGSQDPSSTQQRDSADSNSETRQPTGQSASGPNAADGSTTDQFVIQDPAKVALASGPRHPQVPSRSSTASQQMGQASANIQPPGSPYQRNGAPQASNSPITRPTNPTHQAQGSGGFNYGLSNVQTVQVQNVPAPQVPAPPEEICIECMMRDRDMADVVVRGPGMWDRESDAGIRELLEREDEEERLWRDRHAAELAIPGNKLRPPRRASKGHRLTEQNLKIWLTLNPKEAHARLMTIDSYVRQQAELLAEEAEARRKAQKEAQQLDARMKDTYTQLRQSTYDIGSAGLPGEDFSTGVRIQPPRSSMYGSSSISPKEDYKHKRDMTLLENGMIMERVDVKREEKERRKEEKKARKLSQTTDISGITPNGYAPPMTPNSIGIEGSTSYDFEPPYPASAQSLHQLRPKSAPLNPPLNTYHSHASLDGRGSRFMGRAAWNSGASVAPSGSMMDMHLALDQDYQQQHPMPGTISQHHAMSSFSLPASPRKQTRPHTADALTHTRGLTTPDTKSGKKAGGFGKLWRLVRPKKSESKHQTASFVSTPQDEDMMPLPPPPPMPYITGQRSPGSPHPRQASMPASLNGNFPFSSHPRSISQSGPGSPGPISPTTAPSSLLPSPTSNRFPGRESTGDDRRQSTFKDFTNDINGFVPPEALGSPHFVDQNGYIGASGNNSAEYSRTLAPNNVPLPRSPAPSTMVSSSAHSPRPMSSVHKPLPPPPGSNDAPARPMSSYPSFPGNYTAPRPMTQMNPDEAYQHPVALHDYDYGRQSISVGNGLPPGAAPIQTQRSVPVMPQMENGFQEFGIYNEGYGDPLYMNGNQSDGGKKRRSRFLPFLGKKDKDKSQPTPQQLNGDALRYSTYSPMPSGQLTPTPNRPPFGHTQRSRSSASLSTPEYMNGMASPQTFGFGENGRPMSGVSTFTNGQRPNKSIIDEVVPRDPEFLAYRYPSTEQTLNISRR